MITFIDTIKLKTKFATLLSNLYHNASLGANNITRKVIDSPYFDFLERNEVDGFLSKNNEDICRELFGCGFNKEVNDIGPVYWSGLQYIYILYNYQIPLKVIFLVYPLDKMMSLFDIYHEMNEKELCKRFIKDFENFSILDELRDMKDLSIRQISQLTGIPVGSVRYFEDNNHLYKAPSFIIDLFVQLFSCSRVLFQRKTNFIPLSFNLINDPLFLNNVATSFKALYISKDLNDFSIGYEKGKTSSYLLISSPSLLVVGKRNIVVPDSVLQAIFYNVISEMLLANKDNLLF